MRVFIFLFVFVLCGPSQSATLYVNPSHPRAQDHGEGPESQPFRTVSQALENLRAGDRLVIMEGIYRETVDLKQARLSGDGKVTIVEGASGAKVVIKGSDIVTGWESAGGGRFVKHNWTVNSQQVFVNGVAQRQIGGVISPAFNTGNPSFPWWPGRVAGDENSMAVGDFHYDAPAQKLYIKPAGGITGKTVEVSVRTHVVVGTVTNVTIRNLSVMHSNSSATTRAGAFSLNGNKITLENITATFLDDLAINVNGDDNIIRNNVANYNGQSGMTVRGKRNQLINNETSYNNTRGFNDNWGAGGNKFVFLEDSVLSGHKSFFNQGDGIWFDIENHRNRIENCVSAYNKGSGIHYEISSGAHIKNNLVFGNGRRGIYIANSRSSIVEHNLVVSNKEDAIAVNNVASREAQFPPSNNQVMRNIVAWNQSTKVLALPRASFSPKADNNLFVGSVTPTYGIWQEGSWPQTTGLAAWRNLSGQDRNSWEKIVAMSKTISSTLTARQANVDWSGLRSIALQYRATASGLPPGPTSYSHSGLAQTTPPVPPTSSLPAPVQQTAAPTNSTSSTGSTAPQKPPIVAGIPAAMPGPAPRPSLPAASAVTPQDIRGLSCSSGHKLYLALGGTRFRDFVYELAARTEFRAYRSALERCAQSF
ncbi:MAG: right-handed parallel beta-helix repeat-containing protein [Pyrinomonadaceae bacterium]